MQSVILKKQKLENLVFPFDPAKVNEGDRKGEKQHRMSLADLNDEARREELLKLGDELSSLMRDLDAMGDQLDDLDGDMEGLNEELDALNEMLDEATDSLVNLAVGLKDGLKAVVDEIKEGQLKGGLA